MICSQASCALVGCFALAFRATQSPSPTTTAPAMTVE